MAKDITILFITASEMPTYWADYHQNKLLDASQGCPIICVSRKPTDGYFMNLIDEEPKSLSNIYRQMLRAAKLATTEYVAIAEDDTLYHKFHFELRPPKDTFLYNQNRLALFTWGEPLFHWRNRKSNCSLIAPRLLLIEALEERFAKYPNGTPHNITGEVGRGMVERNMGITERKSVEVYSPISIIQLNHENASEERQRNHRKSYGPIRAYDIFYWGKAEDILKNYK